MIGVLTHRLFWPLVLLAALFAVNAIFFPGFFGLEIKDGHLFGSLVDIARNGAPTLIIAVAMTLVIATRGIDLSVGAVCAIAGALSCAVILGSPTPGSVATVATAIALALGVAVALGLWNGALVAILGIQPIVATLILMTAGRGIAMLITEGQILTVNSPPFKVLGSGFLLGIPVPVLIAVVVVVFAAVATRRTALGLLIESVGINPEASRLAGVRARTIIWTVYAFSGLCAGLAGLVIAANTNSVNANSLGLWIELDAILAVVIGGTSLAGGRFSLLGTFIGALFIATLARTINNVGIPSDLNYLFKAIVVIVVCLLQSPKARGVLRTRRPSTPTPVLAKAGTPA